MPVDLGTADHLADAFRESRGGLQAGILDGHVGMRCAAAAAVAEADAAVTGTALVPVDLGTVVYREEADRLPVAHEAGAVNADVGESNAAAEAAVAVETRFLQSHALAGTGHHLPRLGLEAAVALVPVDLGSVGYCEEADRLPVDTNGRNWGHKAGMAHADAGLHTGCVDDGWAADLGRFLASALPGLPAQQYPGPPDVLLIDGKDREAGAADADVGSEALQRRDAALGWLMHQASRRAGRSVHQVAGTKRYAPLVAFRLTEGRSATQRRRQTFVLWIPCRLVLMPSLVSSRRSSQGGLSRSCM